MEFAHNNGTFKIANGKQIPAFELHFVIEQKDIPIIWNLREQFVQHFYALGVLQDALKIYGTGRAPNYINASENIIQIQKEMVHIVLKVRNILGQLEPFEPHVKELIPQCESAECIELAQAIFTYLGLSDSEKKISPSMQDVSGAVQ